MNVSAGLAGIALVFALPHAVAAQTDGAIGLWRGTGVLGGSARGSLQPIAWELTIEKQADGKFRCHPVNLTYPSPPSWVPCTVDGSSIRFKSVTDSTYDMVRSGDRITGFADATKPFVARYNVELSRVR